jgi:putative transferase (TIGR04331 family)
LNQEIFQRIINERYQDRCSIDFVKDYDSTEEQINLISINNYKSILKNKITKLVDCLNKILLKKGKIIFYCVPFNMLASVKIGYHLKQWPILYKAKAMEMLQQKIDSVYVDRGNFHLNLKTTSDFEAFLVNAIGFDIPSCIMEDYQNNVQIQKNIFPKNPKIILADTALWDDYLAKFWIAHKVSLGTKLVSIEHGGALPRFRANFNFEEAISDFKLTWFLASQKKHVQMMPPKFCYKSLSPRKLIGNLIYKRSYCLMIGAEYTRWVSRIGFYPLASQSLSQVDQTLIFYNSLNAKVQQSFKVKPYLPNQGWNTYATYQNYLGKERIEDCQSLDRAISMSRLIVCTYPETTFSDAIMSNTPTILLLTSCYYKFHPSSLELIGTLKDAKIIFDNPVKAAQHINAIWGSPTDWWDHQVTLKARERFKQEALGISKNWSNLWSSFLEKKLN